MASIPNSNEALAIALEAGTEAADFLRGSQSKLGAIQTKSSFQDWVTEWDIKTEKLIRARLAEQTPSIAVLGEEGGVSGDNAREACWLVDPIDGTFNFAHGLPHFAVSIGLEVGGNMIAGVVIAPVLNWTFAAAKGQGATLNGEAIGVSPTRELGQSILASGFPYDRATSRHNFAEWEHFQCVAGGCRRFGAATLDLAMVACGWLDGYWESRLSPWDLAAGSLLVTEAGGRVTDLRGNQFSPHKGEAVASNALLHDKMIENLARFQ